MPSLTASSDLPDFSRRATQSELMDTEEVSAEDLRDCLADLARVNTLTLARRPTLAFLDRVIATRPRSSKPLQIVDVGSGYGDLLRAIHAWAVRRGVDVSLTGVDLNPQAKLAAIAATPIACDIEWVTADAFAFDPPRGIDVVVTTLFTHHLPDPSVAKLLAWMDANARLGWFVDDLHRHPVPYHFFRTVARLAGWHRFVQHDGPLSIARAFTPDEWREHLVAAQIDPARVDVRWRFPFRVTVGRLTSSASRRS